MKEKYYKYARLLLTKGLCIKEKQPLVINAPIDSIDFVRVLTQVACECNIEDIYYDWYDEELKYTQLKYYSEEGIKKSGFWNKEIYDEYVKKDAAFLFLTSASNKQMSDIDSAKLKLASSRSLQTRALYREKQENNDVSWCIAAVSTKEWGDLVFPHQEDSKERLWELIFSISLVDTENPEEEWEKEIQKNHQMCEKLTNFNIKELHYESSNGTNFVAELAENAIWCGGTSMIKNLELLVNLPSFEVFTTPDKYKTNGIVYASKPLVHAGITIENIMLEFRDGKVVGYDATSGKEELKNIIELDNESAMLGEVALVDIHSKIANSNTLFYETLYDENAACHIALGRGFKECIKDGDKMDNSLLEKRGYNKSMNHVDIMIGTNDLKIMAITYDNKKIVLFENGSFTI